MGKSKFALLIIAILSIPFIILGCSGGRGSGGGGTGDSSGSGNVALFLADGPADEYEHIGAGLKEVILITAKGDHHVTLFLSPHPYGKEVDLLDLAVQKLLLSVKKKVPAGVYSKIRLIIAYIRPEGGSGPCADEDLEIKLPSGQDRRESGGKFSGRSREITCNKFGYGHGPVHPAQKGRQLRQMYLQARNICGYLNHRFYRSLSAGTYRYNR